jgi:signal transduction histidine kinase
VEQTAPVLEATQQLVDRIQAAVGDLDLEERRRLDKRRAEVTLAAQTAEIVSTLGLGLSLGLVLLGWWLQRLELKREVQLTAALTLSRTQLQQLTADLAASNRDLDAFAGRIAHDLKNALTPVAAAAGILRMLGSKKVDNLEATLGDLGGKLTHASSRADMMIDSLLAFSRTGLPTDPVAETIVGVALREVVEGLAPQIASVDATVHLDLEDTVVRCPPGLFNIVAINLIGNALKFLQGMSPRRVRVTARHDERWVVLSIEDSGPGIPSDALERIFEPFYRAHGPDVPGSGIGLATVDRVMRAYGGKVGVRSTLGQGATFEVRFPLLVSASP